MRFVTRVDQTSDRVFTADTMVCFYSSDISPMGFLFRDSHEEFTSSNDS